MSAAGDHIEVWMIERAISIALSSFEAGSRGTGRTMLMWRNVSPGDVIVCSSHAWKDLEKQRAKEKGVSGVSIIRSDPTSSGMIEALRRVPDNGRVHLSHEFVAAWFKAQFKASAAELAGILAASRREGP